MTEDELLEIEIRVNKATQGPWRADVSLPDDVVIWAPVQPTTTRTLWVTLVPDESLRLVWRLTLMWATHGSLRVHAPTCQSSLQKYAH